MTDPSTMPPFPGFEVAPKPTLLPATCTMRASEMHQSPPGTPTAGSYRNALRMVRDSVRDRDGLSRGNLHGPAGLHCAIGCFFADHPTWGIRGDVIDEVATFNDALPESLTPKQRRSYVLRWLNGRLFRMAVSDFFSGRTS